MNRLTGKRAIVTGGALGIGQACARLMAEEGASVAILDMCESEGSALAAELLSRGHTAGFWKVDVTDEAAVRAAIQSAADRFGGLDILVNNAGVSGSPKPTDEVTEAEWDFVQAVNVKGVFFATKHAIPHVRRAGGGAIVNLSSILGLVGQGGVAAYHASKGAVTLMTRNDAITYARERIRVNAVHPGYIWTPMVEEYVASEQSGAAATKALLDAAHPVGHMGEPDDIAWAVVYLASDEAKFVTGASLAVDGGYTAR